LERMVSTSQWGSPAAGMKAPSSNKKGRDQGGGKRGEGRAGTSAFYIQRSIRSDGVTTRGRPLGELAGRPRHYGVH